MRLPQAGGCQCGALRYALEAEPIAVYACHCHQCQRQSGSAFGLSMIVELAALRFTAGEPVEWQRTTPSGRAGVAVHCAACGTRILNRHVGAATASLKPGTLDDTGWVRAAGHIFTESAQPWTVPLRTGLCYAQAGDMVALREAWLNRDR